MTLSADEKLIFATAKHKLETLLALGPLALPEPKKAGKGLEYYALAMLIEAVQSKHGAVLHQPVRGAPSNQVVLRQQPKSLPQTILQYSRFTYVDSVGTQPVNYEIHNGINVIGISGASHELDIAVIRAENTVDARGVVHAAEASSVTAAGSVMPIHAAVECKFTSHATLDRGLGRAFLGVRIDAVVSHSVFVTNAEHKGLAPHHSIEDVLAINWTIGIHLTKADTLFDVDDPAGYAAGVNDIKNLL